MLSTLLTIWLLHVAALLSPGANVLLVSQLAASERGRSAVFAALGVTLGALLWSTFAVLGVQTVFAIFPGLRLGLQIVGGIYLLIVAARLWRARRPEPGQPVPRVSGASAFWLGFVTNITNPKSALFFGSVFAASFPATPGLALQISAVAMIVVNTLGWHSLLAYLFSRPRVRARYARSQNMANRGASALLGALGAGLLVSACREAKP